MIFRIIGIIIGGYTLGFWGAILGYFIGKMIDSLVFSSSAKIRFQHYQRSDFIDSLLILAAAVIKADGRFVKSELTYLRNYLVQTLGRESAAEALDRLQEILQENYNISSVCTELRQNSTIHERLLVIQFLFGLAFADHELHPLEISIIQRIARECGVSQSDYESIKSMYEGYNHSQQQGYSDSYNQSYNSNNSSSSYYSHTIDADYRILEISSDATDEEVKKAYRTLAKKYHPDRVAHLGDDMRKTAEEKFARLSQAYDNIRKARGMK